MCQETNMEQSSVARSLSWTWQILGLLLGTATSISIIKNGFAIDLYGLPDNVLAQYVWLRDKLLAPVAWAVGYFGIEIASWVKDLMMVYGLLGAAHLRAYQVMGQMRVEEKSLDDFVERVPSVERLEPSVYRYLLWPQITAELVRQWTLANAENKYFRMRAENTRELNFSRPSVATEKQIEDDLWRTAIQARGTMEWCSSQLRHIAMQLLIISAATTAFFVWNYLSGLYGPV